MDEEFGGSLYDPKGSITSLGVIDDNEMDDDEFAKQISLDNSQRLQ